MSSDALFLLIKALTKEEKRNFKLSMSKYQISGAKQYLRLFDAIEGQKIYDEKAILKKLKKEDPSFKNLAHLKSYLHRQILKSLRGFYDEASSDIKLSNYLVEIEILYTKELFRDCTNSIQKAKAYATKHERIPYLLRIMEWEIRVADLSNDVKHIELLTDKAIEETKEMLSNYNDITELRQVYLKSRVLLHTVGWSRSPEDQMQHKNMLQHPLMEKPVRSFQGELFRLGLHIHHAQFKRDYREINNGIQRVIQLFDVHPHQIEANINNYFKMLIELALTLILEKRYTTANEIILKLKSLTRKGQVELSFKNHLKLLTIETYETLNRGEFVKALDFLPELSELIEANYKSLDNVEELVVSLMFFNVYFANKDFKNAQLYIQKALSYNSSVRWDLQATIRIANLILQYEQREYEHLGYVIRSTYRFLMKKQRLYESENIILDFLTKSTKIATEKKLLEALAEFKEQLLPYEDKPIREFPVIQWIESKLQKREMSEIMRERYLKYVAAEEM